MQTRLSRCPYPAHRQWLSDSTQLLPCGLASLEPIFFLILVARVISRVESHNMMKRKAQGNSSQSRKRVRRAGRPQTSSSNYIALTPTLPPSWDLAVQPVHMNMDMNVNMRRPSTTHRPPYPGLATLTTRRSSPGPSLLLRLNLD